MSDYRKDFPILQTEVNGHPLVYFDNAATMQMPLAVMEAMEYQQKNWHANVHRGIHTLSEHSTAALEKAREHVASFIGAQSPNEVIFTSGTTQGINLVARSFINSFVHEGDEILITEMEHHSNFLPWREIAPEKDGIVVTCPVDKNGDLDMEAFKKLLNGNTILVAVTAASNVTGAVNPIKEIIGMAHNAGAAVLVDFAQFVKHGKINVQELDCDFMAFSGHKIGGPVGTGVLYGKREMLEFMQPAYYGGGMVKTVDYQKTVFEDIPLKFEAGTPNVTGILGLDAAISYLEDIGIENISTYEAGLLSEIENLLCGYDRITILGKPAKRAGAISFNIDGLSGFDVAKLLDSQGIAVRSGHHCAMPLLSAFGLTGAVRVSPAFYNTYEEIDILKKALDRIMKIKL